jgi:hypothetical protein
MDTRGEACAGLKRKRPLTEAGSEILWHAVTS